MIHAGLKKLILQGKYEAGRLLRQDELAGQFGTSRIPVREALRRLEAEGLIQIELNRGAIVTSTSFEDVLEMLEIRIALESHALRLAIPRMTAEDFQSAASLLKDYDKEPSARGWSEMNLRFHEILYAPCNLPKLLGLIRSNNAHIGRFTRVRLSIAAGREAPQREHYQILKACMHGNTEEAVSLLKHHISQTQKSVQAAARRPVK